MQISEGSKQPEICNKAKEHRKLSIAQSNWTCFDQYIINLKEMMAKMTEGFTTIQWRNNKDHRGYPGTEGTVRKGTCCFACDPDIRYPAHCTNKMGCSWISAWELGMVVMSRVSK